MTWGKKKKRVYIGEPRLPIEREGLIKRRRKPSSLNLFFGKPRLNGNWGRPISSRLLQYQLSLRKRYSHLNYSKSLTRDWQASAGVYIAELIKFSESISRKLLKRYPLLNSNPCSESSKPSPLFRCLTDPLQAAIYDALSIGNKKGTLVEVNPFVEDDDFQPVITKRSRKRRDWSRLGKGVATRS